MAAQNTVNVSFWLTTGVPQEANMDSAPVAADPTAISVSTTGGVDGDVVVVSGTNWQRLDKPQIVSNYSESGFDCLGCNTLLESGASKAGKVALYTADAMTKLCPSSFTDNSGSPSTINVGTFCDPTQTIASAVQDAGTMEIAGYVDINDPSYTVLYEAAEMVDQRYIRINISGDKQGYLVAPVTALGMNWDIPLEGAVGYTITFVKGSATRHLY
jgi:hypothetical protein